jgi:hypothetical protein
MTSVGDRPQDAAKGSKAGRFKFAHCPHCNEQVIPDTSHCPACSRAYGEAFLAQNQVPIRFHFASDRWTLISMGLDPWGRRVGKAVAGTLVAFVLYAWWVYGTSAGPRDDMGAGVSSLLILGGAHEIWAFSHGRPVYALRQRYPASLANIGWRTLGLAGDVIFAGLGIHLLVRGV